MLTLYIDDSSQNRAVIAAMLATAGLQMDEASGGTEGLEKIDRADYDLVLVDLRMPEMDGLDVIRALRSRPDHKATTPVVVVTADQADDLLETCRTAGADAVVVKPVQLDVLFETVGRLLASRASASI